MARTVGLSCCNGRNTLTGGFSAALPTARTLRMGTLLGSPCVFSVLAFASRCSRESVRVKLVGRVRGFLIRVKTNFTFVKERCRVRISNSSCCVSVLVCGAFLRECLIVRLGTASFVPRCVNGLGFCYSTVSSALYERNSGGAVNLLLYGAGSEVGTRCTLHSVRGPVNMSSCRLNRTLPGSFHDDLPSVRRVRGKLGR